MPEVFLSYRSTDAWAVVGIRSALAATLGRDQIFRDVNSMPPGTSYPAAIRAALTGAVFRGWLRRRL